METPAVPSRLQAAIDEASRGRSYVRTEDKKKLAITSICEETRQTLLDKLQSITDPRTLEQDFNSIAEASEELKAKYKQNTNAIWARIWPWSKRNETLNRLQEFAEFARSLERIAYSLGKDAKEQAVMLRALQTLGECDPVALPKVLRLIRYRDIAPLQTTKGAVALEVLRSFRMRLDETDQEGKRHLDLQKGRWVVTKKTQPRETIDAVMRDAVNYVADLVLDIDYGNPEQIKQLHSDLKAITTRFKDLQTLQHLETCIAELARKKEEDPDAHTNTLTQDWGWFKQGFGKLAEMSPSFFLVFAKVLAENLNAPLWLRAFGNVVLNENESWRFLSMDVMRGRLHTSAIESYLQDIVKLGSLETEKPDVHSFTELKELITRIRTHPKNIDSAINWDAVKSMPELKGGFTANTASTRIVNRSLDYRPKSRASVADTLTEATLTRYGPSPQSFDRLNIKSNDISRLAETFPSESIWKKEIDVVIDADALDDSQIVALLDMLEKHPGIDIQLNGLKGLKTDSLPETYRNRLGRNLYRINMPELEELSLPNISDLEDEHIELVLGNYEHLKRLNLTGCKRLTEKVLKASPELTELHADWIQNNPDFGTDKLKALLASAPKLHTLTLGDTQAAKERLNVLLEELASKVPSLPNVVADRQPDLTDSDLANHTRLGVGIIQSLIISKSPKITLEGIVPIAEDRVYGKLKHLVLADASPSLSDFQRLAKAMPNLEVLVLGNSQATIQQILEVFPKLTSLTIYGALPLDPSTLGIDTDKGKVNLKRLKMLDVRGSPITSDLYAALRAFGTGLKNLQVAKPTDVMPVLDLSGSTDVVFSAIGHYAPELQDLALRKVDSPTNHLMQLAKHNRLPKLQHLDLTASPSVWPVANGTARMTPVVNLLLMLPSLKDVKLPEFPQIPNSEDSDEALKLLNNAPEAIRNLILRDVVIPMVSKGKLNQISIPVHSSIALALMGAVDPASSVVPYINASQGFGQDEVNTLVAAGIWEKIRNSDHSFSISSQLLTDDALKKGLMNRLNVTSISLSRCTELSNTCIKEILSRSNLTSLSIVGCTQIGDEAIAGLTKEQIRLLTRLDLTGTNVSYDAIKSLLAIKPDLQIIYSDNWTTGTSLLKSGVVANLNIIVDGTSYAVNGSMLGSMCPSVRDRLKDLKSGSTLDMSKELNRACMPAFLTYLYTGELMRIDDSSVVFALNRIATQLGMNDLSLRCEHWLRNAICIDTLAKLYTQATEVKHEDMIAACCRFAAYFCRPDIPSLYSKLSTSDQEIVDRMRQLPRKELSVLAELTMVAGTDYVWEPDKVIIDVEGEKFAAGKARLYRQSETMRSLFRDYPGLSEITLPTGELSAGAAKKTIEFLSSSKLEVPPKSVSDAEEYLEGHRYFEIPSLEYKAIKYLYELAFSPIEKPLAQMLELVRLADTFGIKAIPFHYAKTVLVNRADYREGQERQVMDDHIKRLEKVLDEADPEANDTFSIRSFIFAEPKTMSLENRSNPTHEFYRYGELLYFAALTNRDNLHNWAVKELVRVIAGVNPIPLPEAEFLLNLFVRQPSMSRSFEDNSMPVWKLVKQKLLRDHYTSERVFIQDWNVGPIYVTRYTPLPHAKAFHDKNRINIPMNYYERFVS